MNAKIFSGVTALYYAVQRGYENIVKILIEHDVDIESATIFDDTVLMLAARHGNS